MEAEQLTDKLAARLDLSEGEAEDAGQLAADLYRDAWGESLGEVNAAIGDVITLLGDDLGDASSDVTKRAVEDALTIADVWDKDVNEVVRAAAALLSGDLVDSADEAFDVITTGLSEGADLNGDFLDSLFEYSTHFGNAGLSAEAMLSGLIAGTEAGMMGVDKVGDAVKEMSIRLQDGSTLTHDALTALGLDADAVAQSFAAGGPAAAGASAEVIAALAALDDPLEQTRLGVALMGTPFEDLGSEAPAVLDALAVRTLELRDTADVATTAYDNTATSMEELKRRGLGAVQDLVAGFLSGMGVGGEDGSLKSGIDDLATWISENEETIRGWGETAGQWVSDAIDAIGDLSDDWGEFKDAIDPILSTLGDLWEMLSTIGGWLGEAAPDGFWLSVIEQMNPLLGAIRAVKDGLAWIDSHLGGGGSGPPPAGKAGLIKFHSGGVVPGMPGTERLALLEAGETVIPAGAGASNITIVVEGSVVTQSDLVQAVREGLIRADRRSGQAGIVA
jgi:phage-related minor tail protein